MKKTVSAITRVNAILKKAGRDERLVRGRGYYYLRGGEASSFHTVSIYACWIEPKDFTFACREVVRLFGDAEIYNRISRAAYEAVAKAFGVKP